MTSSTIETDVLSAITTALSAGNGSVASSLAQLLHIGTAQSNAGLDFSKKTMTTTWYSANSTTAITLIASGWTIIPG